VVNEVTLEVALANSPGKGRAIGLRDPAADFSQDEWEVRGAVNGNAGTGWAVWPEINRDHVAVFGLAPPVPECLSLVVILATM
jgi:hypothetical protein